MRLATASISEIDDDARTTTPRRVFGSKPTKLRKPGRDAGLPVAGPVVDVPAEALVRRLPSRAGFLRQPHAVRSGCFAARRSIELRVDEHEQSCAERPRARLAAAPYWPRGADARSSFVPCAQSAAGAGPNAVSRTERIEDALLHDIAELLAEREPQQPDAEVGRSECACPAVASAV